jgi:hypothetical protein
VFAYPKYVVRICTRREVWGTKKHIELRLLERHYPGFAWYRMEQFASWRDDEWRVGRRCFSQESMRRLDEPDLDHLAEPTPLRLALVRQ